MVEANPPEDLDNMDWGDDGDGDEDWGEWDDAVVEVEFEQPELNRAGSSFDSAFEIYSTK